MGRRNRKQSQPWQYLDVVEAERLSRLLSRMDNPEPTPPVKQPEPVRRQESTPHATNDDSTEVKTGNKENDCKL